MAAASLLRRSGRSTAKALPRGRSGWSSGTALRSPLCSTPGSQRVADAFDSRALQLAFG